MLPVLEKLRIHPSTWRQRETGRTRKEEQEKKGRAGGSPGSAPQKKEGLSSQASVTFPPLSAHSLTRTHTQRHTLGTGQVCGYVVGLSGLLTGFPPFITAGSLVLLLGGTAALGTVSPTSCNDGSLYMATGGADDQGRKQRNKGRAVRKNLHVYIYLKRTCTPTIHAVASFSSYSKDMLHSQDGKEADTFSGYGLQLPSRLASVSIRADSESRHILFNKTAKKCLIIHSTPTGPQLYYCRYYCLDRTLQLDYKFE